MRPAGNSDETFGRPAGAWLPTGGSILGILAHECRDETASQTHLRIFRSITFVINLSAGTAAERTDFPRRLSSMMKAFRHAKAPRGLIDQDSQANTNTH
jgi:hypothetical protein